MSARLTPIVFLDTETDGVHPGRQVWEVAMIRRDEHGERETQFFVDIDLASADPFGLKIGGFYDRHPLGRQLSAAYMNDHATSRAWDEMDYRRRGESVTHNIAAMRVARWTHGAHIVGAVPNFDTEVLGQLLRDQELTPSWHYHLIDVESLAVGFLHGAGRPAKSAMPARVAETLALPWKSDDLSRTCGVEPPTAEERHTALGDARWVSRLYDAIMSGGAA